MNGLSKYRFWLLSTAISLVVVAFMTRSDSGSLIGMGGLALIIGAAMAWYDIWGPGKKMQALRALWGTLPGAIRRHGAIEVHDGMQPLTIHMRWRDKRLGASIYTPVGSTATAFRVWSHSASAPSLDPRGSEVGGPPVEEARVWQHSFAGRFYAEASDEKAAQRFVSGELLQALYTVAAEIPRDFVGLTFDGQSLGVHVAGGTAADPTKAARIARSFWTTLVDTSR